MAIYDFTFPWEIDGICVAEFDVRVEFDYSPPSPAYYDRSYGNWFPGDDADLEITDVWLLEIGTRGKPPRMVEASGLMAEQIIDYAHRNFSAAMIDNANEDAWARQCDAADFRRDCLRDEGLL